MFGGSLSEVDRCLSERARPGRIAGSPKVQGPRPKAADGSTEDRGKGMKGVTCTGWIRGPRRLLLECLADMLRPVDARTPTHTHTHTHTDGEREGETGMPIPGTGECIPASHDGMYPRLCLYTASGIVQMHE